jgi:organic hydroperoxide reductase OsmC/OhrA
MMAVVKTFRYPVSIDWWGNDLMNVHGPDKGSVRVAPPREFGGTHPNFWSPEELLAGAIGSCYAITLRAVAERLRIPLSELEVEAIGHVERAREGGYRFTLVDLDVAAETDPGHVEALERAAKLAEKRCIVGTALGVPLHVRLVARTKLPREEPARELVSL